jgi:hypothetical protein
VSQTVRSPSLDEKLRAPSNPFRRRVVRNIAERTARTGDRLPTESPLPDDADPDRRRSLQVELVHGHLPKLAEGEFVERDADEGTVRPGPAFDELLALLEATTAHQNDWA